jgi:transglutaminase-like putative cysteine protease
LGLLFGWFLFVQSLNELRRSRERARGWAGADGAKAVRGLALLMVWTMLGVSLLAAGLYLVLPRNPLVALHLNFQPFRRLVGFSNSVRLGEIGELQMDRTPAFRVKFLQGVPPPVIRFRGVALADFNGTAWSNTLESWNELPPGSKINIASDEQRRLPGQRLFYEVQTLATMDRVIFSAGVPEYIFLPEGRLRMNAEGSLRQVAASQPLPVYSLSAWMDPKPHYGMHAVASDTSAVLSEERRRRYVQLPVIHPRIRELAESLTGSRHDPLESATLLEHFLLENFSYSLKANIGGKEPLLDFLFFTRAGHCEYFASALAVMLRSLRIPARVVTGFNVPLPEAVDGWYVVRSYHAHSWVEVWVNGRGWVTFDPTPPGGNEVPVSRWGRWVERMQNRYLVWSEEWVGGMGRLRRPKLPDLKDLAWLLAIPAIFFGILARRHWLNRPRPRKNVAAEVYRRYLTASQMEWTPGRTAREIEALAQEENAKAIRVAYERARYGRDDQSMDELKRLVQAVGTGESRKVESRL